MSVCNSARFSFMILVFMSVQLRGSSFNTEEPIMATCTVKRTSLHLKFSIRRGGFKSMVLDTLSPYSGSVFKYEAYSWKKNNVNSFKTIMT